LTDARLYIASLEAVGVAVRANDGPYLLTIRPGRHVALLQQMAIGLAATLPGVLPVYFLLIFQSVNVDT